MRRLAIALVAVACAATVAAATWLLFSATVGPSIRDRADFSAGGAFSETNDDDALTPVVEEASPSAAELAPGETALAVSPQHRQAVAELQAAGVTVIRHGEENDNEGNHAPFTRAEISGELPGLSPNDLSSALRRLDDLREVRLYSLDEPLGPELEHLASLPELRSLQIAYCRIAPVGFEALAAMSQLQELLLHHCRLRDGDLEFLRSLPELRTLSIESHEELTAHGLQPLEATKTLRAIELGGIPTSDRTLRLLRGNRSLRSLRLRGGLFTALGMEALCDDRPLSDLEEFELVYSIHSREFLSVLRRTPNLRRLTIVDRGLTEDDYAQLPPLPELRELEIITWQAEKPATGDLLRVARRFESLESFSCDAEDIRSEHLQSLREMKQLSSLSLNRLVLNDEAAAVFARMPNLAYLDIAKVDPRLSADALRRVHSVRMVGMWGDFGNSDLLRLAELPGLEKVWFVSGPPVVSFAPSAALYAKRGIELEIID